MKRIATLLIAFLFALPSAMAQDSPDYLQIAGKVIDGATGKPMHYASITLAGTNISNVSNAEGIFSLKYHPKTPSDALVTVSHLGYATITLKLSDFGQFDSEHPMTIRLTPVSISLDPALIRAHDPYELVLAALYRIKQNYPTHHVGMTAFYREMVKKGNTKYLTMNEAPGHRQGTLRIIPERPHRHLQGAREPELRLHRHPFRQIPGRRGLHPADRPGEGPVRHRKHQ